MVGSLNFDMQGWGWGVPPSSDPLGQTKRAEGVQELDIFLGYHKCMVPK